MALNILSSLAVERAFATRILPEFAGQTGLSPHVTWNPTTVLMQKVAGGERGDVIVLIDHAMNALAEQGIVAAASVRPIATATIGLAVAPDAAPLDISSAEQVRSALLSARSVAWSRAGASGGQFHTVLERLGIAEEVLGRATAIPEGFTAREIMAGRADMAIQQVSELMTVEGVRILGPLPPELNAETHFSIAAFTDAANRAEAEQFIAFATGAAAHAAYNDCGLISRLELH
ncbi:substrate-binding domain-containing protein [Pelagibacterium lacus]|uniref:ABC transporter substrate-binding protein n=1 Tax=Pelagibacterium lacus TaxID=2282655 RepID=A0A369VZ51_9HYPH|nr:substrate-binding domain-containing protein [Pelagibacterium lacus]RDE07676.1 ABC transporter substrate-binding protein [Pelagibacterium lacus]